MITSRTSLNSSSKRSRFRRASQSGFTLVEVAMASFVMAFGIASAIIAMQAGFRTLDVARGDTLAAQIMQSEIERLRLMAWGSSTDPANTSIASLEASATVDLSKMFTSDAALTDKFVVTRLVSTDALRADVRNITINVTWKGFNNVSHTRQFTTNYAKNGLYDYYYTLAKK